MSGRLVIVIKMSLGYSVLPMKRIGRQSEILTETFSVVRYLQRIHFLVTYPIQKIVSLVRSTKVTSFYSL